MVEQPHGASTVKRCDSSSIKYLQTDSPVGVTGGRYGDLFGTNNNGAGLGVGVAERAQNNAGAGVCR